MVLVYKSTPNVTQSSTPESFLLLVVALLVHGVEPTGRACASGVVEDARVDEGREAGLARDPGRLGDASTLEGGSAEGLDGVRGRVVLGRVGHAGRSTWAHAHHVRRRLATLTALDDPADVGAPTVDESVEQPPGEHEAQDEAPVLASEGVHRPEGGE